MVHCPSCGAGLHFDIATQQMKCDYCQSGFDPQHLYDNTSHDAKSQKNFESYAYICPDCGAELLTNDKQDAIGFCPYCGGASMLFDKIRQDWRCEHVIPFSVTKEQCKEAYAKEVRRHPFVSRKYRDPQLIESFRGIYMPYWCFDAELDGKFSVTADHKQTGFLSGTVTTRTYMAKGKVHKKLNGYTHDASISFDDHLSEKIAPYDTSKQVPFNPGYLCGFYAEAGDASDEEYDQLANRELEQHAFEEIAKDPSMKGKLPKGQLTYLPNSSQLPLKVHRSEKTLYPVWFMSYRHKNKLTYATVNGQTGKVGADLPLSPLRILLAALGVAAAVFGLLLLLINFLPSVKATTMLGVCAMLLIAGLYVTQNSFVHTVSKALHSDISLQGSKGNSKSKTVDPGDLAKPPSHMTLRYLFLAAVAVASVIGFTSDGSYAKTGAFLWGIVFVLNALALAQLHYNQGLEMYKIGAIQLHTESMLKSGILQEAKKLLKPLIGISVGVYLTTALYLVLVFLDLPHKTLYYGLCFVIMASLFAISLLHIRFQVTIAKRRPPQFNKKGARYDEN